MADLRRWAFATLHAGLLVLLPIWLIHLSGDLGDILGALDTALGLGLFTVLWGISWVATGRGFDRAPPATSSLRSLATAGVAYGALTGAAFLLVVLVGGGLLVVVTTGGRVLPVLVFGFVGLVVALVVGGVIGVAVAFLDASLHRLGERLTGPER